MRDRSRCAPRLCGSRSFFRTGALSNSTAASSRQVTHLLAHWFPELGQIPSSCSIRPSPMRSHSLQEWLFCWCHWRGQLSGFALGIQEGDAAVLSVGRRAAESMQATVKWVVCTGAGHSAEKAEVWWPQGAHFHPDGSHAGHPGGKSSVCSDEAMSLALWGDDSSAGSLARVKPVVTIVSTTHFKRCQS